MRISRRQPCTAPVQQVSRHAEVNEENATRLEPNNQILATTIDGDDPLAFQLGGHPGGVEWSGQARIVDLDTPEAPAHQHRLEACSDRLYLGQFGHEVSLAWPRRAAVWSWATPPGYAITSSTTGRVGGGSSANA